MKKILFNLNLLLLIGLLFLGSCKDGKNDSYTSTDASDNLIAFTPVHDKLPVDVKPTCIADSTDFKNWFVSGNISKNGAVNPANSVTFGHQNNCDFYQWSEQMFLWMTSPSSDPNFSGRAILETPEFYTVSPKVNGVRTLIPHKAGKMLTALTNVQKTDSRIDSEEGQATDDVLMSQKGSLIYYISMVNDVYAQFLTGAKAGVLGDGEFPTTKSSMDSIVNYATSQGVNLSNPETLAMELKTSWVDASTISNSADYVTIDAIVPVYDKVSETLWTQKPDTSATVKLALIGVHVVGSVNGHPEMIWATFEHKDNAPNLSYEYVNVNDSTKTVAADSGKDWLLNSDASNETYNVSHMLFANDSIKARPDQIISASNTKMILPWGVAKTGKPNPENATPADSNTEIIAINNSVLGQLIKGDVRRNYIFIGATWTNGGAAPNGTPYSETNTTDGMSIGTSRLANSTMETYFQYDNKKFGETANCFFCHSNTSANTTGLKPGDLSHIYDAIQALSETSTKTP
ncbi:MAG: hypothetical protein CL613_06095 [Aquimarina sp.]|nr:hypothetical protein [Aquimarina sp.]